MQMKISQDLRSQVERTALKKSTKGKQSFEKLVQKQSQQLQQNELQRLVQNITEQGEKVARFRSLKGLATYKRMIREFLQEAVYNGMELSEARNFNMSSYSHKLVIVKEVDEKLVQLTNDMMDQEKKTVDLLGVIGEISGLLVNLYT